MQISIEKLEKGYLVRAGDKLYSVGNLHLVVRYLKLGFQHLEEVKQSDQPNGLLRSKS